MSFQEIFVHSWLFKKLCGIKLIEDSKKIRAFVAILKSCRLLAFGFKLIAVKKIIRAFVAI
jgi:hypothetical protein